MSRLNSMADFDVARGPSLGDDGGPVAIKADPRVSASASFGTAGHPNGRDRSRAESSAECSIRRVAPPSHTGDQGSEAMQHTIAQRRGLRRSADLAVQRRGKPSFRPVQPRAVGEVPPGLAPIQGDW
jgi:hypothetical protein